MTVDRKCRQCQAWFKWQQRNDLGRGKFCSKACASIFTNKTASHLTTEARRRGAAKSAITRRARAIQSLSGLSLVEIYRKGYSAGWHRGVRYARGIRRAEVA